MVPNFGSAGTRPSLEPAGGPSTACAATVAATRRTAATVQPRCCAKVTVGLRASQQVDLVHGVRRRLPAREQPHAGRRTSPHGRGARRGRAHAGPGPARRRAPAPAPEAPSVRRCCRRTRRTGRAAPRCRARRRAAGRQGLPQPAAAPEPGGPEGLHEDTGLAAEGLGHQLDGHPRLGGDQSEGRAVSSPRSANSRAATSATWSRRRSAAARRPLASYERRSGAFFVLHDASVGDASEAEVAGGGTDAVGARAQPRELGLAHRDLEPPLGTT